MVSLVIRSPKQAATSQSSPPLPSVISNSAALPHWRPPTRKPFPFCRWRRHSKTNLFLRQNKECFDSSPYVVGGSQRMKLSRSRRCRWISAVGGRGCASPSAIRERSSVSEVAQEKLTSGWNELIIDNTQGIIYIQRVCFYLWRCRRTLSYKYNKNMIFELFFYFLLAVPTQAQLG